VEPYLERLLQIHDLFSEGKTPEDVLRIPRLRSVYVSEKRATAALISYYKRSGMTSFKELVEAVKTFARADALRLSLRAHLRAIAIASLASTWEKIYIESGHIHFPLYRFLRKELNYMEKIRVVYLLSPIVKKLKGKRRNLGSGDVLTLLYSFHDEIPCHLEDLLAARSLIYIKLIEKEELLNDSNEAPHSADEVKVNRLVDRLDFEDCRALFEKIRSKKRRKVLELAENYAKNPPA